MLRSQAGKQMKQAQAVSRKVNKTIGKRSCGENATGTGLDKDGVPSSPLEATSDWDGPSCKCQMPDRRNPQAGTAVRQRAKVLKGKDDGKEVLALARAE